MVKDLIQGVEPASLGPAAEAGGTWSCDSQ